MYFVRYGFLIAAVISLSVAESQARTWKSADGMFSVEAEFVDATASEVTLKKADGKVIRVPLAKLSADDQAFVASEKAKAATPATPAPASDKPAAPADKPSDLEPLTIKVNGVAYTLDAPKGAVSDDNARSPTISGGDKFEISLMATSPGDIQGVKDLYGPKNESVKILKKLIDDGTTYAILTRSEITERDEWVFVTIVKVGNSQVSVIGTQPGEAKWTQEDVQQMLRSIRTLRPAQAK
jgi:hypothetical protein